MTKIEVKRHIYTLESSALQNYSQKKRWYADDKNQKTCLVPLNEKLNYTNKNQMPVTK